MDEEAPRRSSQSVAILAMLAVAGSAVGVMIYQLAQKDKPTADTADFDISKTQESRPAAGSEVQTMPPGAVAADRTMLQIGGTSQMRLEASGNTNTAKIAAPKAADNFIEPCRQGEALAEAYAKRYPSIAQLGKDWMSYPDLKKLHDDYDRDDNPIAFLHGVAHSKNFAKMLVKYAPDPAVQSFVKAGIAQAPSELTSSIISLLKEDNAIKTVASNVAAALGLPPALTAGIFGGGQVDQKQVMGKILQGNPGLQGTMQDPNAQNAMPQQDDPPEDRR